ncbi:MAG: SH3 domain-containing protein [Cytophagales bacterium]|nr:SH3 domain-containing protein [Cytophagales bacterium]
MIGNLKTLVFCLLLNTVLFPTLAQSNEQLADADSLFMNQKYTEAFSVYSELFTSGEVTQAMLLKMAFIKEGLGDTQQALLYLDQYYTLTADKSVLLKMQELADENQLNGYKVEDKDFFLNFINLYLLELQVALLAISLFLLAFTHQSKKKKRMPLGIPILQIIVLATFLILSNDLIESDTKIIQSSTLLMSGPSAGAEPVGWINSGHKVEVIDKSDVWTKIRWEEEEAYIRNSKLK